MRLNSIVIMLLIFVIDTTKVHADVMSIPESLAALDRRPHDLDPASRAKFVRMMSRLNPEAKTRFWEIVRDPEQNGRWVMAVIAIGYVGDDQDVQEIAEFTKGFEGQLVGQQSAAVRAAVGALGTLAARDVDGAATLLESMTSAEYWTSVKFELMHNRPLDYPSVQAELACTALFSMALSPHWSDEQFWEAKTRLLRSLNAKDAAAVLSYGWLSDSNLTEMRQSMYKVGTGS